MRLPISIFGKRSVTEDCINESTNKMSFHDNNNSETDSDINCNTGASNPSILSRFLPSFKNPFSTTNSTRNHNLSHSHRFNDNTTITSICSIVVNNNNIQNINSINTRPFQFPDTPSINSNAMPAMDSPNIVLDINSNITYKHRDSLEDSGNYNSDPHDRSDLDNDNDAVKRRSFHRSDSIPSVEDSGFSSCNGLSDEKDDTGVNTSFDNEDGHISSRCNSISSVKHPFSLSSMSARRRARTFSMDSTSSDLSDSNTSDLPTLSSSLPVPHIINTSNNNNSIKTSNTDSSEQTDVSCISVVKRRSFRNKNRRNSTKSNSNTNNAIATNDINSVTATTTNTTTTTQPQLIHTGESDVEIDTNKDHNNNCADFPCKNLSSSIDAAIPFRFADLFQGNGLITLVACIIYTVCLFFLVGAITLSWAILKKFINKSDLKDLRENMLESRRKREMVTSPAADLDGGS